MTLTEILTELLNQFQETISELIDYTPRLVAGLLVGILMIILVRIIRRWARRATKLTNFPQEIEQLAVTGVYITGILVATIITLSVLGVNVAGMIAGLGISGLVVGFALKDIIENLLAGVLLLIQQPFRPGDRVEIANVNGHITNIQIRATTLRTLDNLEVVIPNRTVYTSIITNYDSYSVRRRQISLGVGYGENLSEATQTLLDTLHGIEGVAEEPAPFVALEDFGDSAIIGTLFYYIDTTRHDFIQTHDKVLHTLHQAVNEQGIDLPYPTSVVINK